MPARVADQSAKTPVCLADMHGAVREHLFKIMGEPELVEERRARQKNPDDPTTVWISTSALPSSRTEVQNPETELPID